MLRLDKMAGIDDAAMDDQIGTQRFIQFFIVLETLAHQARVARPDHASIRRIDVDAQHPGNTIHMTEEILEGLGACTGGTTEKVVGVLGRHDAADEARGDLRILADHAIGEKVGQRPRCNRTHGDHRRQGREREPADQIEVIVHASTNTGHFHSPALLLTDSATSIRLVVSHVGSATYASAHPRHGFGHGCGSLGAIRARMRLGIGPNLFD